MAATLPQLDQSIAEIDNPAGSKTVVAARFEAGAAEGAALISIAAGGHQRLEKFSRVTLTVPDGGTTFTLRNPSPLTLDIYRETHNQRTLEGALGAGQARQMTIGKDEQLFLLPRLELHIPPPPHIVEARYNRGNPLTKTDNFVSLHWIYPPPELARIVGFRLWRALYRANTPLAIHTLTPQPIQTLVANIGDFGVNSDENHRYAVTAMGRNGIESLFSNVLILDRSSLWGLIDAGSIPL